MKKLSFLSFLLFTGLTSAFAQATIISDLNTGSNSSSPGWMTLYKNNIVLYADNGVKGNELWKCDTSLHLVADINPGTASSGAFIADRRMAVLDTVLYFAADNGADGSELYMWNNLSAPVLAYDINPGAAGSDINELVAFNGKIFFSNADVANGSELWAYNPSNNSIKRYDILIGPVSSSPHNFTVYKGQLYFAATGSSSGTELYRYDPANDTVTLAADIYTGGVSSDPQSFVVIGDTLYFSATSGGKGRELCSFDSVNAKVLTDVNPNTGDGMPLGSGGQLFIATMGGNIYFAGDDGIAGIQLYKYNRSSGTASLVYKVNNMTTSSANNFMVMNNKLYFSANDGVHGDELWMYDGTGNPYLAADINPGSDHAYPAGLIAYNGYVYFSATDLNTGTELYRYRDTTLSIQNLRFDAEVQVYPNPATAEVHINMNLKHSEALAISITDMAGRLVYQSGLSGYNTGKNDTVIPLTNFVSGVYLYRITNGNGTTYASGRLIKE